MTTITVRRPRFDLADLPRWWVGNSRLGTWFGDAGHVFIPLGELFFIDAVKAFRGQIDDDGLRREVASFIGQESVHSRVHEAVWDQLREHGLPVDRYAQLITWFRETVGPHLPDELQLATTAALEHYTAAFGRAFLTEDLAAVTGEEMAALLRWHGAEEIEHRSVAFDVLAEVDAGYGLRLAGLALGTVLLTTVPLVGVAMFAAEDLRRGRVRSPRLPNVPLVGMAGRFLGRVATDVARYATPSFHPGHDPEPAAYHRWVEEHAA